MSDTTRGRVISGGQVRLSTQAIRVGGHSGAEAAGSPGVGNVREVRDAAGNVAEIHVQCECGKVTVVACDYA